MPSFDKKLCMNNIYYLVKKHNLKIGDIENKAEISPGYFSRINKEDSKTNPSIEVLCSIAEQLSVSLDALISVDFTALTPDESYVLQFLETLKDSVDKHKDSWEKEVLKKILNYSNMNTPLYHPMLCIENDNYDDYVSVYYRSDFYPERSIRLLDDIYYLPVSFNETIFLSNTVMLEDRENDLVESKGYELYLKGPNKKVSTICCAYEEIYPTFYTILERLFNSIKEAVSRTSISDEVRGFLKTYMKNKQDDDLPF